MPEVLGPSTIANLAIPSGWDATTILNWQLKEGRTYEQVVAQLALALGSLNDEFIRTWGWMFSITDEPMLEYPDGAAVTPSQPITDLSKIDVVGGTTIGSMLPMRLFGEGVGGSWKYFVRTREAKVLADFAVNINRLKWRFEIDLLTRFFSDAENVIGSGRDVPFVRGGGAIPYTPPAYQGVTFTNTHNHFLGVDSTTEGYDVMLNSLAATLEEHGHTAPFRALVAKTDVQAYQTLPDFVKLVDAQITIIDRGGESSGNRYYAQGTPMVSGGLFGRYQSPYGEIELMANARLASGYAGLCKSYGQLDARNPLLVRVAEEGFGVYIISETSDSRQFPVKTIKEAFEFGVGVGRDRTNGAAARRVSGGAWANPTIS